MSADAPFRALVVDDEAPARAKATRFLATDPRFVLVGEAVSGLDALGQIETLAPELLLLDVQMPGTSGFDVLEAVGPERRLAVVFSTAHEAHALRAFDAHAVDYLLKPYDATRFRRALDKAWAQLRGAAAADPLAGLVGARRPERIALRSARGWVSVEVSSISRLAAAGKYVEVFLEGQGAPLVVRQTLAAMLARLEADRFCRVHRGEVVRLDAVVRMEPLSHGDAVLVLRDGTSVVLSRTHRRPFQDRWALR
ncbi:MAG: LytR/AlgR family response regulator transcription factor [Sandaracinaceae bacterium]